MAYYLVIGGRSKKRFDRFGRETFSAAENAKLPSVTLASLAASVVSQAENEPAEVWRVTPSSETQIAVYMPYDPATDGGVR